MAYGFKNLIFEGGGVKGIAYVGALRKLTEREIVGGIERVGGTSAGAINAVLLGLGYSLEETDELLRGLDFNRFLDSSWGILRDCDRLIEDFGWYKGDYFRNWIGTVIRRKTGNSESTFADAEAMKSNRGFKSLYFMGTNLSTGFSEVFSAEHTPRMCIADAVRISMSIPLFFAAKRSARGDVYVDGGVINNYPIKLFDREKYVDGPKAKRMTPYYKKVNAEIDLLPRPISEYVYNKQTLGFRLDTREEISLFRDHAEPVHKEIKDFFDYGFSLIEAVMSIQNSQHLHSDDWHRTIYIDTLGVKTTEFDLSDAMKDALVASGEKGVKDYFSWYDTATDAANK